MLILVHQSTNKEKKPVTPHSGPRCRPGHSSSPVTLQAATQRSTRTYLGGCSTTPIIHMLMTALHYPTIPTLPSSPVRTTSNSTPALSRGTSYPPRRSPSVCISNTYTSPSSSQESVWDGKQCRAPGTFRGRPCRYRSILPLGPASGPLPRIVSPPSCCSGPALHPCRYLSGWHSDNHGVMCTEWQYG